MTGRGSYRSYVEARNAFAGALAGSLVLAVLVHVVAQGFMDRPTLRLALVVVFFAAVASVTWSFTTPYAALTSARLRWRFADAGPAVQHTVSLYLMRQIRFFSTLGWIATTAVFLMGLHVISWWDAGAFLRIFGPLFRIGSIVALAAIPLYVFASAGILREIVDLRRTLDEQAELGGLREKTREDVLRADRQSREDPVTVTGPLTFRAGGFDWSWSDFYKNAAVFGQTGSGKTVCVLNALLDGLLSSSVASGTAASGLILDPKGDFRSKLDVLCRRHGRERDLVVIDPHRLDRSIRWNPLDSTDNPLEIAGRFAGVMETLNQKGENDAFWIETAKTFVQNMIAIIRAARPGGEPPNLSEIYDCGLSDDMLIAMVESIPDSDDSRSAQRAVSYMSRDWMNLADNTKSVVRTYLGNMLGPFLQEPYDTLFSGRSTMTVGAMIDQGKILYVGMPVAEQEIMAKVVSTFVKLEFFREVLRRIDKPRPSFFLCDEFQTFMTTGSGRGDEDAFERTRQSNHANIIAFQNLPALLKRAPRRDPVDNLLGNCAVKLFLRNTDVASNEYASGLFGDHVETMVGTGSSTSGRGRSAATGRSLSTSAQYGARVRKEVFSGLAIPSRDEAVAHADCMAHIGSRGSVRMERLSWPVHPLTEKGR